jgi:hypothetical protein
VRLALPDLLVPPAPRAFKASKDRSVPRGPSASKGRLVLPGRPDRLDRRARREKPVAKAQSAPPANAGPPGPAGPAGPKGDPGATPAIRVVTGTDSIRCGDDEVLAAFVCASGATEGAKCATPGTAATGLCVRR